MGETRKRKEAVAKGNSKPSKEEEVNLRYGPLLTFPKQNRFARIVIVLSVAIIVYFYSEKNKEKTFASSKTKFPERVMSLSCSAEFQKEISAFKDCVPRLCGRGVYDEILTPSELDVLRGLAERGLALGSPSGGAAILDLHSGALSHGNSFIDIYNLPQVTDVFSTNDFEVYKTVRTKIQRKIAAQFRIRADSLHLAKPTFFSKLTSVPAKTIHDEYWHLHVDKETYESFHYTALVYLSDYGHDFEGGRFLFVESDNSTSVVEPARGRVSVFTSGSENPHRVERVTRGERLAVTVAFTCDASRSLPDPVMAATKPVT